MQAKDEVQSEHFQMEIYELKWQQDITRKKRAFEPNDQALDGIFVIPAFSCQPFSRR